MAASTGDTPQGLECLIPVNKLMIAEDQNFGPMNPRGFKRYHISDASGSRLFFCSETKELELQECCCKHRDITSKRPWTIETFNGQDTSILTGTRTKLKYGCCGCNMNYNTQVSFSSGLLLGGVYMAFKSSDGSTLKIQDASGTLVLQIKGQMRIGGIFSTQRCHEFPVMTMDNQLCGMITWYSASVREPSNFGAEFPADLDVKIKALLIYAIIMIEFYYVQSVRQHRRRQRQSL